MITVRKVLNNNVVLCTDGQGREYVATGRGIAFLVPVGAPVDPMRVHRLFVSTSRTGADRLAVRIAQLPAENVSLAITISEAAGQRFGAEIVDRLILPLADHLSAALDRAQADIAVEYPLQWETVAFYPEEVAFARTALDTIEKVLGVRLPEVEAVPIGLHLVNAELGSDNVSETMDLTELMAASVAVIRDDLHVQLDDAAISVARFTTHLRHLIARIRARADHEDRLAQFLQPLAAAHPDEHASARRVATLIAERLGEPVSDDEVLLLTLHVARLVAEAQPDPETAYEPPLAPHPVTSQGDS